MAQFYYSMIITPYSGVPPFIDISGLSEGAGKANDRFLIPGPYLFTWSWGRITASSLPPMNKSEMEIVAKFNRERLTTTDSTYGFGIFLNCPETVSGGIILLIDAPSAGANGGGRRIILRNQSATNTIYSGTVLSNRGETRNELLNNDVYLRLQVSGGQARARVWWADEAEPTTWAGSGAFVPTPANTTCGIIAPVYGGAARLDFVSVGTDGDPAPLEYPGGNRQVVGVVRKPDNSFAAGYIVRCYHRNTGCLLGEMLSDENGAFLFSLPIPETEHVYCLAVDQLGNSWNAPIKDLINPGTL